MYNVFNMGIGFVLIVNKEDAQETLDILKEQNEEAYVIGEISNGTGQVKLTGSIMIKIAVFASGNGSNFEKIMENIEAGYLDHIEVTALYTDNPNAFV